MRLILLNLILFTLCATAALSQTSGNSQPKESDAFLLDQTTPEQAVKILGKPQEDKTEKLSLNTVEDWLKKDFDRKNCRVLFYYPFKDLGKVRLIFSKEKLVVIDFIIEKKIPAIQLSAIYKTHFVPVFNDFDTKKSLREFEKTDKNVEVADFPQRYNMIALTSSSVLTVKIFNDDIIGENFRRQPRTSPTNTIRTNPIIGKATEIQIISRRILD